MDSGRAEILRGAHFGKGVLLSTVSGVLTTEPGMIRHFAGNVPSCDIITTKSYQVVRTSGHREPVIYSEDGRSFGNFVGLRNPGIDAVADELLKLRTSGMRQLLNVSLAANRPEDFITLVRRASGFADIIELNFSCPHADKGFGASIGSDASLAADYVRKIRKSCDLGRALLLVKLTPNTDCIGEIAKAVVIAGADGVAAINTMGPYEYVEKASGSVFFNAREGGRGGLSGEKVRERALECVREIRLAVGNDPIVIGMGGVASHEDAMSLKAAGADAVGIGSALSRLDFRDYERFFSGVKRGEDVSGLLASANRLAYERRAVEKIERFPDDCAVITLSGKVNAAPGEFMFLWIPQVGEKPFSPCSASPLKFLIKKRGPFTSACHGLKPGDAVYLRGPYGAPVATDGVGSALILAGGSGVAVAGLLAETLSGQGAAMSVRVGVGSSSGGEYALERELRRLSGDVRFVADDGVPGRFLDSIDESFVSRKPHCFIIGPEPMMKSACARLASMGVPEDMMFTSRERLTLCGIGMCGECECGGRLICKSGTFCTGDIRRG